MRTTPPFRAATLWGGSFEAIESGALGGDARAETPPGSGE